MSKYFILILAFFLIAIDTNAQQGNLTQAEIIANYMAARGGINPLQSVPSMQIR